MSDELPPEVAAVLANAGNDFIGQLKEAAPTKAAKVDELLQKFNVSFGVDTEAARVCFYAVHKKDGSSRKIVVGARCLNRLWATAYAYFKLYNAAATAAAAAKAGDGKIVVVDFMAQPGLDDARKLLKWAILTEVKLRLNNRAGKTLEGFEEFPPAELPQPFAPSAHASPAHVANQLSFMAMSFILHHELAHIYCEHIGLDKAWIEDLKLRVERAKNKEKKQLEDELQHEYTRYILVEKEADTEAARWLLTDVANPDEFWKRILGVVIGLSWLASTDPYIGPTNSPAYPPGYDRLFQTIDKFVDNAEHDVWGVVAFILVLHLQNSGNWQEKPGGYTTFREVADWATDIISKQSKFAEKKG